jgi:hypothetical protein
LTRDHPEVALVPGEIGEEHQGLQAETEASGRVFDTEDMVE